MRDRVLWKTAPPLWRAGLDGAVALDRPVVLRFDSDDFMTTLRSELDGTDRDLGRFTVRAETWRAPAVGLGAPTNGEVPTLYQPTHGRFYLVSGGLVCARYGLPDKAIHPNCDESVFAVLRRLEPTGAAPVDIADRCTYRELGWVPSGLSGQWEEAGDGLAPAEERLPLFPLTYRDGHRRRLLAGLVPVSGRERYERAVPPVPVDPGSDDPAAVVTQPGRAQLENAVFSLQALLEVAQERALGEERPEAVASFREAAFFALVDLAGFLVAELPEVWDASVGSGDRGALVDRLIDRDLGATTWMTALHQAHAARGSVLADLDDAPPPVTGMDVGVVTAGITDLGVASGVTTEDEVFRLVHDALSEHEAAASAGAGTASPPLTAAGTTGARPVVGAVYTARLAYERPRCRPPDRLTLSPPTPPFRLAQFHDPDAPFREHRLVLPIDTSLEGLRRSPRAVRMELSAQLRKQVERVQGVTLTGLDEGDIPDKPGLSLGMVCSLSIPIITICALILLLIIVSLLNIVFFWLPLFRICLPKGS